MRQGVIRSARVWMLVILAVLMMTWVLVSAPVALAWDDCPKGLVDDPYPGACSRYVDTNDDGICDHSQPEPTAASTPITTVGAASYTAGSTAAGDTAATGGENDRSAPGTALAMVVPATLSAGGSGGSGGAATGATSGAATAAPRPSTVTPAAPTIDYNLSPIALSFLLIYLVSFILYRTHRIRVATHRKIWNVLLLFTFLLTGVLGMVLVVQLNWGLRVAAPFDMLFWHVETGIVMSFISFFHIGWHFRYYRNLLGRKHGRSEMASSPQLGAVAGCRTAGTTASALGRGQVRYVKTAVGAAAGSAGDGRRALGEIGSE